MGSGREQALHFITCSGLEGRPGPQQSSEVRSHVMREYLRQHPRRSKNPKNSQPDHGHTNRRRAGQLQRRLQGAEPDTPRQRPLAGQDHEDDDAADLADDSPQRGRTALMALATARPKDRSIPSIRAPAQMRHQARDIASQLFSAQSPWRMFIMQPETFVSNQEVRLVAREAADALSLLLIAMARHDRRYLLSAMTSYQRALARTQRAIQRSTGPLPADDFVLALFVLLVYEQMMPTGWPGAQFNPHATAFVTLLRAKDVRRRIRSDPTFDVIGKQTVLMALNLGLFSQQPLDDHLFGILDDHFSPADRPLLRPLMYIPEHLRDLTASQSSTRATLSSRRQVIRRAFHLWQQVQAALDTWVRDNPDCVPTAVDIRTFPIFYNAVGEDACQCVPCTYLFCDFRAMLWQRTAWVVLLVLGHHLIAAATAYREESGASCLTGPLGHQPATAAPHHADHADDGHDDPADLEAALLRRLDVYADELCRTFACVVDQLATKGRMLCWIPVAHLHEYYLQRASSPESLDKLRFLAAIQQHLLPGFAIQRLLAAE